ncbi:tryptophan--tRNA ligase [Solicola gregarius]|uniref:Tryptophan--tRNA ligase n=1 Tax=Solicola gregarius TaxID=2908642 RepID=A0AA46TKF9_9ACTN|nr:tryptophan--tRNA ligase [Solicola gregarius]UYM06952.1 tryptophan--tRNA ligase [Solicola gregarius]
MTTQDETAPGVNQKRGRQLSLLTPSGHLTLGNLLGALRPMRDAAATADCFYGISDLHAMTTPHDPAQLSARRAEVAALMLASGLDPHEATLLVQSRVPAHSELLYLLECTASMGETGRMIQYKEKGRGRTDTRVSLFTYPILMAADILLYRAAEVPVGDDQRQHVEFARELAQRFNHRYGEVFTVPRVVTPQVAARVMDLSDPTSKMSKSTESPAGSLYLLDPPEVVRRKVSRAVTDSRGVVAYDRDAQPGITNLIDIASACTGETPADIVAAHATYGGLKGAVADAVIATLEPIQKAYAELSPGEVDEVFAEGSQRAAEAAAPVIDAAKRATGL